MKAATAYNCNWCQPPDKLSSERGQLDIWLLELDKTPCQPECLDAIETKRLNNFKFELGRQQYCSAHTSLRIILGRYLDCAAREVPLTINSGGKPRIDYETPPPLYFNLSHAGNTALLAVRAENRMGIDIENHRDLPRLNRLARRTFRENEITQLENSNWNSELFFKLWTRMEARQKCLGRGVFGEAVEDELVETRSLSLQANQCAAIAWPAGTEPDVINFYRS